MTHGQLGVVFFGDSSSRFSNTLFQPLRNLVEKKPARFCLKGLVDTPKEGWISTNPETIAAECSFLDAAENMGVPILSHSEEDLSPLKADLFIAVGYTRLIKEPLLSLPAQYTVNFHASLLPAYRGKHPVFRTLQAGEKKAGLSVHVMDTSLDTGPLIF